MRKVPTYPVYDVTLPMPGGRILCVSYGICMNPRANAVTALECAKESFKTGLELLEQTFGIDLLLEVFGNDFVECLGRPRVTVTELTLHQFSKNINQSLAEARLHQSRYLTDNRVTPEYVQAILTEFN